MNATDLNKFIENTPSQTVSQTNRMVQPTAETCSLDEMLSNSGIDLKYKDDLINLVKSIIPTIPVECLHNKDIDKIHECLSIAADDFASQILYGGTFADTSDSESGGDSGYDPIDFNEEKKCVLELMTNIILTILQMPKKANKSASQSLIPPAPPMNRPSVCTDKKNEVDKIVLLNQVNDIRNQLLALENAIRNS